MLGGRFRNTNLPIASVVVSRETGYRIADPDLDRHHHAASRILDRALHRAGAAQSLRAPGRTAGPTTPTQTTTHDAIRTAATSSRHNRLALSTDPW